MQTFLCEVLWESYQRWPKQNWLNERACPYQPCASSLSRSPEAASDPPTIPWSDKLQFVGLRRIGCDKLKFVGLLQDQLIGTPGGGGGGPMRRICSCLAASWAFCSADRIAAICDIIFAWATSSSTWIFALASADARKVASSNSPLMGSV